MDEIEKQLKKNGMLLKSIPSKERTEEQCRIAVHQNPKALRWVPYKLQSKRLCKYALRKDPSVFSLISARALSEDLCMYAVKQDSSLIRLVDDKFRTKKVCLIALSDNIEELQYVPISILDTLFPTVKEEIVVSCLAWIQKDISASAYLPESLKTNHVILQYQKEQNCISYGSRFYNSENQKFCVEIRFQYWQEGKIRWPTRYTVQVEFTDFDEYYNFLDQNLEGVILKDFNFQGIDLHRYNISGAVISSDILLQQGLYDDSYYRSVIAKVVDTESSFEEDEFPIQDNCKYPRPIEDDDYRFFEVNTIPVFYISDIHLCHRIVHHFKKLATKEEIYQFIREIVERMIDEIGTIPYNSILLIGGDTSSVFDFSEIFYTEIVKYWRPERVVVISGNHELWDPPVDMIENISVYRSLFSKLGISYLQNDLLCIDEESLTGFPSGCQERIAPLILSEKQILKMLPEEIHNKVSHCPLLVLGGVGFSGLNEKYNAINLRYGCSFDMLPRDEARKKEIFESERFDLVYRKLLNSVASKQVIVLTHMRKDDWSNAPYIPHWVYVNGHNHRNYYEANNNRKVYADNQIGYHNEKIGLKYFYTDSEYDAFANYDDGLHIITSNQYIDFNRGKQIDTNLTRMDRKIHMLKKNGYYMFLYYGKYYPTSKNDYLYLLDGGRLRKLDRIDESDIQYYYENLERYVDNVRRLLERYSAKQNEISQFIKKLGGSGRIHGCIIDVDMPFGYGDYSYTHLFVNPIDGTVTPYFAFDVKSRLVYKDLQSLLENNDRCKKLLSNYTKLKLMKQSKLPALRYSDNTIEFGEDDAVSNGDNNIYRISRVIKSLQYCLDKNVVRMWNENLLNYEFIKQVMISNNEGDIIE